jgi:hypothetical protein
LWRNASCGWTSRWTGYCRNWPTARSLKRLDGPLDDTEPANRPIAVRDLLTFRMGFGMIMEPSSDYPIQKVMSEQLLGQGPPKPPTPHAPDEWIRSAWLPLMHQPGEKWMYHTGVLRAGRADSRAPRANRWRRSSASA